MHIKDFPHLSMRMFSAFLVASLFLAAAPAQAQELDLVCMQTAAEKYHNALITATDAYGVSVRAAQVIRRDGMKSSWGIADRTQRKTAIKDSTKAYRDTVRTAGRTLKDAERVADRTFDFEGDLCGG